MRPFAYDKPAGPSIFGSVQASKPSDYQHQPK